MRSVELWTSTFPGPRRARRVAASAEAAGWDGLLFTDSQNLSGDVFVALAMAARATHRIGLGTGVTNPVTRHPAVTACAIASIQSLSGGRAVLGIGRGDSALFHLGLEPAPLAVFARFLERLQGYLRGEVVDLDGFPSQIRWLAGGDRPKVPVDVAATGPKTIDTAALLADRISFSMGASPDRIRWGIDRARTARAAVGLDPGALSFGAYVTVAPHRDVAVARDLVRGRAAVHAHFSGMAGSTGEGVRAEDRAVFRALHAGYDREHHTQAAAAHNAVLDDAFVDRFAVVGPPAACVARLREMIAAGVERLMIGGPATDANPAEAERAMTLLTAEVLPGLRAG